MFPAADNSTNSDNLLLLNNTASTTVATDLTSTSPNLEPLNLTNLSTSSIINNSIPSLTASTSMLNNGPVLHQNVVSPMQAQQLFFNQFKLNPCVAAAAAMMINFQNNNQTNNNNNNAQVPTAMQSATTANVVAMNAMNVLLFNAINNQQSQNQQQLAAHFQNQQQQQSPLLSRLGINFSRGRGSSIIGNHISRITPSASNKQCLGGGLDSAHQSPPMKVFKYLI